MDGIERSLVEKARQVLPGGHLGNMDGDAIIRSGKAGRVWDVAGREYVDFLIGSGPMLVGHAHPEVTAVVQEQIARGTTFFANNEPSILLAEAIVAAVPCAEQVRFTSSGTEADAYAMRLARAHRRRDKILKFEGGYHGMSDYAMMSLWPAKPGNFPLPSVDSAGIPASMRDTVLVSPFNDLKAAEDLIRAHHDELAGVIVEPMQRLIPPAPGFLQGLRAITAEYRIPLIFDEVVTGFRLAYGGGQTYYGVTPDLCTLGKVIGGGFPLAAVAGRADIMAHFDRTLVGDAGFTPQIGTLSGNPVAAAAGLATLAILQRPGAYEQLFATGTAIRHGLEQGLTDAGFAVQVPGEPPMFDAVFTAAPVQDYRGMLAADTSLAKRFNALLRERGVFKSAGKIYVSLAHDEDDVRLAVAAFSGAAQALRASLRVTARRGGIVSRSETSMRIHIQNLPTMFGEPVTMAQWEEAAARAGMAHHEMSMGHTMEEYAAAIPHTEALVTSTRNTKELFPTDAPKLRMIFCTSAGLDSVPFDALPPGVPVLNNSGVHAPKAGEYGIMAILMLGSYIPTLVGAQRDQAWRRLPGSVLDGRRVTVLGLGSLGGAVAQRARQFGMRVTGVRTTAQPHPDCERVIATADLDSVLPQTEYLVIACPLTQATRNIVDRRRLGLLPKGAGVVNIGRGPLLDQDALCDMLDDGTLGGAVLDVFVPEPVPEGHRLWTTRNLIMTPHVSCDDPLTYNVRSLDTFLENIVALEAGLPLPNLYLPDRGY